MRENIDILRVYNLVDSNGTKILLRLGRLKGSEDYSPDKGFRWSFVGTKIPMPVRSRTWFNGFPEATMMSWLMDNGWHLNTCVDMKTGKATVYELPKGNEDSVADEEHPIRYPQDKSAFEDVIRYLYNNSKRIHATRLFRYAHGVGLHEAYNSVKEICGDA